MRARPPRRVNLVSLAMVLAGLLVALWSAVTLVGSDQMPEGFTDTVVAKMAAPTGLAFVPDGRILVTTQPGQLRLLDGGRMAPSPALDLSEVTCTQVERGLLGIAVDPEFAANRFIYLFYTFDGPACVNRVSRFVLGDHGVVDPSSEVVLLDNIPSPNGNHNGGDLQFGLDGYLYVSVGEGGCDYAGGGCNEANDAARDRHVLLAKVLRITGEGGIPPDNPFLGPDSARCNRTGRTDPGKVCQETFAWGLRNPFRLAFDPNAEGVRFFINDVGQDHWEEIDEGKAGADYGWNVREGHCPVVFGLDRTAFPTECPPPPPELTDPIYDYPHTGAGGCNAITGGAFVPRGVWPPRYDGAYLFGDFMCGRIFQLIPKAGGGYERSEFLPELGPLSAVHLAFGPHNASQSLYYTSYANGGEVHRIDYIGGVTRPAAPAPPVVPAVGPAANNPPAPRIEGPEAGHLFSVGETITLAGAATDAEDGPLPDSQLTWTVVLHHGNHTHPYLGPVTGNNVTLPAPAPESLTAARDSYLEVRLTARDSGGSSATVTQELRPRLVEITFGADPPGLDLVVNDVVLTAPDTIVSWAGYPLSVWAPGQDRSGRRYTFLAWTDGGDPRRTITTPASPATYTALFIPEN
jgi:glucose/arabinose dehydrogenase